MSRRFTAGLYAVLFLASVVALFSSCSISRTPVEENGQEYTEPAYEYTTKPEDPIEENGQEIDYAPEENYGNGQEAAAPEPLEPPSRLPVLAYHSVVSRQFYYPINEPNQYILLDEVFYKQMRYLYENGFNSITSSQLIDFLFYDGVLPQNPIAITFDDGYLDNYLFAAPIMRQFGFTGMVFLITGNLPETSQSMTAFPLQFLSAEEILASTDVFEFGSHAHYMHAAVSGVPPLATESVENIRADIRKSFEAPLTFRTGFAYPHGRHSDNAIEALREEGVRFAFATHWGYVCRDTNPFILPRFSVVSDWSMELFSQLVGGEWED